MIERLKVWLSLPFAMPGPIELSGSLDKLLALIASLGLVFTVRQSIRIPTWTMLKNRMIFGIPNLLSNSKIPFLRCEILHKLNAVFVDPIRWQSHGHYREADTAGHFDFLDMADPCVSIAKLTVRQVSWINKLPSSLKELYRQRMFASIRTGREMSFGYRAWSGPDRFMTEEEGSRLVLNEGK